MPQGELCPVVFLCPKPQGDIFLRLFVCKKMEVIYMTLNILFLTIKIKKRKMSITEINQYEMIKQIEEENRNRQASLIRMF